MSETCFLKIFHPTAPWRRGWEVAGRKILKGRKILGRGLGVDLSNEGKEDMGRGPLKIGAWVCDGGRGDGDPTNLFWEKVREVRRGLGGGVVLTPKGSGIENMTRRKKAQKANGGEEEKTQTRVKNSGKVKTLIPKDACSRLSSTAEGDRSKVQN